MYPVELTGARVRLREFRPDDADAVFAYATDPRILAWTHWQIFARPDADAWLAEMDALAHVSGRTEYQFALTLPRDDIPIGGVRIRIESVESERGSIGYILSPEHQGNGYVTEAAGLLIAFGFDQLALHRIEAFVVPSNAASAAVCERLGMKKEGVLRGYFLDRGARQDAVIYSIIREDH